MTNTHVPVVVVGAGQAGLSVSWYLGRAGIEHLVLEAATPVHAWSDSRWDNFTLVTPNWHCRLPGYSYSGPDPDGFMTRDQVVEWLNGWLATFTPPLRTHTRVTKLTNHINGGFELTVEDAAGSHTLTCDHAVIATGGYPLPVIPPFAATLDPSIRQLHSELYRNPDQLPDGAVLVVGTGQSGTQIAEDLHLAGRAVHLAVGGAPRVARTYRGRDCMTWLSDMGLYDRPAAQYPGGKAAIEKTNHYVTGRDGGRDVDLRQFALEGMTLYGSLTDGRDGQLRFAPNLTTALDHADSVYNSICADIDAYIEQKEIPAPPASRYIPVWTPEDEPTTLDLVGRNVTSIVWAIGYRPDYRWIEASAFDGAGRPMQTRGITGVAGLSFIGLPWMHTWGSGRFLGIDRDARHVAESILAQQSRFHTIASAS
ncbi:MULTISPECIES: MSMEG_0569 family flavin-dependent oxidoreductase [Mycobacteriaceae]|uniref:FAD-dependent oxidoreductase n=1 Tax=Mycolicibacterium neoaurum VKM Ac-1815D TaxID=700508 RepID=V5X6V3_MYCNE|nr:MULTISPECIES: MSMEG_0569 family flavin-dependent oxidoreductase [Mycobacteriaceae]AHC23747.1 FAD-dependent oxidoreductase [Mycolicibacterium neoaurum VKM Ac-1815D]AMO04422.1 FAD-dependent oxidoreductase [Mycolicibacterium neoaurum]AXK77293.1 MSMEG_0569 family flavin-dependent oxidoreductase [Mycolicibacterium neoaurum]KJQ48192.1 FAD-dependent oxidoreductase [Mycolicibacterium neoaurum]KUM06525.1 FAD-dependent oxidoreductase [Mycolicibacterium neoaurum]